MVIGTADVAAAAVGDAGGKTYFAAVGWAAIAVGVGAVAGTNGTRTAGAKTC